MTELYISPLHNLGDELCVCGDCGDEEHFSAVRRTIDDAEDRLTAGGVVPAGQCRKCGGLSYLKGETHSVTILWGESPEEDDKPVVYEFGTAEELLMFMQGVEEASGWLGYKVIKDEEGEG